MALLRLDQGVFFDKRVLLRVDLNVPMHSGRITNVGRIQAALPTIQELLAKGAKLILISHLGRPVGQDKNLSLRPVFQCLSEMLPVEQECFFCDLSVGPELERKVHDLKRGQLLCLENIRFYSGEEKNTDAFAQELANLGDLYVNDAFSVSHRAHASVDKLPRLLPHYMGRLFEKEVEILENLLHHPKRPILGIVGGAKVSSKLGLLTQLVQKLDGLILGGGIANTFLKAQGIVVGQSLVEESLQEVCQKVLAQAQKKHKEIVLPQDVIVEDQISGKVRCVDLRKEEVAASESILDMGTQSVAAACQALSMAHTLVWNGTLGKTEDPRFAKGSLHLGQYIEGRTEKGDLTSILGGGDTAAFAEQYDLKNFSYISLSGGAFLEWLEGKRLPGVEALES